jgi:hypothetical protein
MDKNPLDRIGGDSGPIARRITAGAPGLGAVKTSFNSTPEASVSYDFDHTLTINKATLEQMVTDVVSKQTGHAVTKVSFNVTRDERWEHDFYLSNVQVTLGSKL